MVKTRLAARLGDEEALRIYLELGTHAVTESSAGEWETVVAYTPDDAGPQTRRWLGESVRYAPQGQGDLGDRMARSIRGEIAAGAGRVVVIGTDCPELTSADIENAFAALDDADVVFGPATDGGYYLVGTRGDHPALFYDIAWSSTDTLALTLKRAAEAGLRVRLLATRSDIDTVEDLQAWQARMQIPPLPGA